MKLFAISDIHIDYPDNARWVDNLSDMDYRDDILILAGDITEDSSLLAWCLGRFAAKFRQVLFVPGNHDLWVRREAADMCSLRKFEHVMAIAEDSGASSRPYSYGDTLVVPLLGWYDYSFGKPNSDLSMLWMDFRACRWPDGIGPEQVTEHFLKMNPQTLPQDARRNRVVTFSHFLPRIDLIPFFVPASMHYLNPVLGSSGIEGQLRALGADTHVYGHSHINRRVSIDGVTYINNAFGYPQESLMSVRRLVEIG
ncbi:metallophosphoesterase family protein [Lysobacter silvisoli]|uniref:Metallophosphoesterase n=1 Tax=Lysobacter silvisoli TaxID=2293254 RepID=A0A371K3T2_9GAMM|nr:metallophosphoesterase [Lysobacter silvisoli]RDZ28507.1 metallophosphoesterase [Lysobacter silvisoli]